MEKQPLIEALNEFIAERTEAILSTDSGWGAFVSGLAYGEADPDDIRRRIRDGRFTDEQKDYLIGLSDSELLDTLADVSIVEMAGVKYLDHEVFGVIIGEVEEELPEELEARMQALPPIFQGEVVRHLDAYYRSGSVFIDCNHDRIALVVDTELLDERMGK